VRGSVAIDGGPVLGAEDIVMNIPTPARLQKLNRRLDRQRREAQAAFKALRAGAVLVHQFGGRGSGWILSTGKRVSEDVARILTFDHRVVGCGDSLFGVPLSQSWRWVESD
jgi:hypothetical protein